MTGRARVLALTTEPYHGFGGIAQYGRDLLDALCGSDDVAEVVNLPRLRPVDGRPLPAGLREVASGPGVPAYAMRACALALSGRPAVVLCGHVNLLPVAWAAARLAGAATVLLAYGIDVWQPPRRPVRALLRGVDLVLAISRCTRRRLLAWAELPPERVRLLPNAIHLERYAARAAPVPLATDPRLADRRVLLTVGRLSATERYKGHDRVIAVLPRLLERFPDLAYLIVGDGDDRPRLERLATEAGVAERVVFAGRVSPDALRGCYERADAFAMPSTGEGFGFVFLEAMACGLPTLGGSTDGGADPLGDGELGVLVDPHDREALVEGLDAILRRGKQVPPGLARFDFPRFAAAAVRDILDAARAG